MPITPVGGWKTERLRLREFDSPEDSIEGCPACHSSDWRSASLIYQEGLSVTKSQTRGITGSVGRIGLRDGKFAISGGVYQGHTRGSKQTLLSAKASPPQRRRGQVVMLGAASVLLAGAAMGNYQAANYAGGLIEGLCAVGFMIGSIAVYTRQNAVHDAAMDAYHDTRMCQRCGTLYLDEGSPGALLTPNRDRGSSPMTVWGLWATVGVVVVALAIFHRPATPLTNPADAMRFGSRWEQPESSSRPEPARINEGLPLYIADALHTPNLAPSEVSLDMRVLSLGTSDQKQYIPSPSEENCMGSGGCLWKIVDAETQETILPDSSGSLYKTRKPANGYYDIVVSGGTAVVQYLSVYEYRDKRYEQTACYERSINPTGPAQSVACP